MGTPQSSTPCSAAPQPSTLLVASCCAWMGNQLSHSPRGAMEVSESVQLTLLKVVAPRRIEKMRRAEQKEGSDKQRLEEDLEEARERLDAERAAQRLAAERVEATTREVELLRADLAATKQNLDKAEGDKTRVRPPAAA